MSLKFSCDLFFLLLVLMAYDIYSLECVFIGPTLFCPMGRIYCMQSTCRLHARKKYCKYNHCPEIVQHDWWVQIQTSSDACLGSGQSPQFILFVRIAHWGPAMALIGAAYSGCDRVLTVTLLTIAVGINGAAWACKLFRLVTSVS